MDMLEVLTTMSIMVAHLCAIVLGVCIALGLQNLYGIVFKSEKKDGSLWPSSEDGKSYTIDGKSYTVYVRSWPDEKDPNQGSNLPSV